MAKYTLSIRDILQQAAGSEDIHTIDGIYNVASRVLFPADAINVISERYRKQLIVGFSQHYFNDEIGLETPVLWQMALSEKLYNYGSYINAIYDNIDKQIFADYRVKTATVEGQGSKSKEGNGSVSIISSDASETLNNGVTQNEQTDTTSRTAIANGTGTVDNKTTGTTKVDDTGTISKEKGGSDTTTKTGTSANAKAGNDSNVHTGGYSDTNSGSDSVSHEGKVRDTKSGSDTVVNTGTDTVANTGTNTHAINGVELVSDTPMGSLGNMRTPGGDATGRGVAYATGQNSYNYLSAAKENDSTDVETQDTLQTNEIDNSSETQYDSQNEREYINNRDVTNHGHVTTRNYSSDTETKNYNSSETRTDNLQDKTQYGGTDEETRDLENLTTHNTDELQTRNTTDTTTETGSVRKSVNETVQESVNQTKSGNKSESSEMSSDETNTTSYDIGENEHTLNWEMLYRSMPLLNKLWDIFDDLFMLIY